jgi:hypothetical protein
MHTVTNRISVNADAHDFLPFHFADIIPVVQFRQITNPSMFFYW